MGFENVQLWFAKDKTENIITINKVDKTTSDKYYCPLCGSEVIPRQGEVNSWCFAHVDKSNCSSESMFHFWYKNKLIEIGDKFKIKSDIEREYICKEILIEQTYIVNDKQYNPDLTIITECGKTIYFEMEYSNKKKLEDYLDIWNGLGNIVVEVDTKTLINSGSKDLLIFKALWYEGKCFNVKNGEDSVYHQTIGEYKELYYNTEFDEIISKDMKNLDWLWKDIQKYKMGEVDINHISELIHEIEDIKCRKIVISILKRTNCQQIIKDYIQYYDKKIKLELQNIRSNTLVEIEFNTKIPRLIYDRFYTSWLTSIKYREKYIFSDLAYDELLSMKSKDIIEKSIERDVYLKNYHERKEIFNKFKGYRAIPDYSELCQYIDFQNEPYLNYYYSRYSDEHRLYFMNFKNTGGEGFLRVMDCINEEYVEDYLNKKSDIIHNFLKEDIVVINQVKYSLNKLFEEKVKFVIYGGCRLAIYLTHLKIVKEEVYKINSSQEFNVNNIFDDIKMILESRIKELNSEQEKQETISAFVKSLNKKYSDKQWNFKFRQYDIDFQGKEKEISIGRDIIESYLNDKISKYDFQDNINKFFIAFSKDMIKSEEIWSYISILNENLRKSQYSCYRDYRGNFIGVRKCCYEGVELGMSLIKKYKNDEISFDNFKQQMATEISNHIRKCIYKQE